MKKSLWVKGGIYFVLLVCVVVIMMFSPLKEYLSIRFLQNTLQTLIQFSLIYPMKSIVIYVIFYIVTTSLFMPTGVFLNLLAGALWGNRGGIPLFLISTTCGATGAFIITRFFAKDFIHHLFSKQIIKVLDGIGSSDRWYLLSLRLTPLFPYGLINISFAFSHI